MIMIWEVVQDTWVGVLRGIDGFEGRSSFRTWLIRILVNRARTAGARERRTIAVGDTGAVSDTEAAVAASRFDGGGSWPSPPERWIEEVEDRLAAGKLAGFLRTDMAGLPGGLASHKETTHSRLTRHGSPSGATPRSRPPDGPPARRGLL
jgi:RNA polymerase sigma-70 factor (ECF subfamily)